jgi:hypothetical protein
MCGLASLFGLEQEYGIKPKLFDRQLTAMSPYFDSEAFRRFTIILPSIVIISPTTCSAKISEFKT